MEPIVTHCLADRMASIEPFYVMDILAHARQLEAQGRHIIHMEIGEPDFDTPQTVIEAGKAALQSGKTHYTPAIGLPALREALSDYYQAAYQKQVSADHIVITPGASGALLLLMGALVNPGDEVLMADPGYPCNRHFVRLMEGQAVGIPVDAISRYQLNIDLLAQYWNEKTKLVMLASPSNPTGTLLQLDEVRTIERFVAERNAYLIVDEIYHGLVYEKRADTAATLSDRVFVINSFSKYFNMTGWRLGWLVAPSWAIRDIDKLAQNIFLAAPTLAQHAALAAFDMDTLQLLEQRKTEFQRRRDYLLPALRELGFNIPVVPEGAFYLYADCGAFTDNSFDFCKKVLQEAGVAITPGIDFGQNAANQHVRFAYTTAMDHLKEGVARIKSFLRKYS